ncbi:AzlC family ABC transporter permease [Salinisphaera sp. Q1T1-3]|uniref:AzlC family ABC transporter permease n=1 Tax=Salinisphaera sp. Q1T1-3 TaxID=2321229 RepID=UPI000E7080E3|nr:AzlC family ABC transporter permease [Salinisphaera sp. Q1T1-3]RJS94454.1 branched-chain amino acid ABC transporter permease [Salinisphaera sp. Q1T1-3]
MCSNNNTAIGRIVQREVWPVCAAYALVGASFGAIAATAGMPWWVAPLMSLTVFAGSAQFAALGIVLAGGGLVAALVGALVINARLMAYGFQARDALGRSRGARLATAHLITDVNTALILREHDSHRRHRLFRQAGLWIFAVWNLSVVAGLLLGDRITDTAALGLDAVLPAILFALARPHLGAPAVRRCALTGAVLAIASAPFVPPGVPVLIALVACLLEAGPSRRFRRPGARS